MDARRSGQRALAVVLAFLLSVLPSAGPAFAQMRIKDLVEVEGVRSNQLIGYGLVVGLDGTGDRLQNSPFTQQSLEGMLERMGVNITGLNVKTRNVAAVMVTAELPPFARQGSRLDVSISTMGDATSLLGGSLLATPLIGADGSVYAVAQGSVAVGGFSARGEAASVTKGVPTAGRIPNGGIVEREVEFALNDLARVRLTLRNPDFSTATRIAQAVNRQLGAYSARATDPTTVELTVPGAYAGNVADLISRVETLPVTPDQPARVVIDEQSGTIVMGDSVRISTVAIAQGNLTVRVTETPQVSQPGPFAQQGQTVVVPRTDIEVEDGSGNRLNIVQGSVSLRELVDGLNRLGAGPRDIISILQAIKAAGALHADLEVL
ncbi:flagellar basal body P-ring protein FlgI [Rhodospirillum centenum]|uniref:Flagellar P-ring protein n=1 Tax=Rhodospirillum centenum (strain ATCC 51521 / SW) TaxID=414684 RepID=B6IQC1_RHOCS|nr:flagellar basal body P-ring protein FlgI [Rhodospirillum centenum]ACI97657.1 flagellar P-ring protein FlgI [Rhodospirillum centenum SW]